MKNNISQMSATFTDVDPFVKVFDHVFGYLRLYLTNYASDVGFQGFNGLCIIYMDLIIHIAPQQIV